MKFRNDPDARKASRIKHATFDEGSFSRLKMAIGSGSAVKVTD